MKKVKKWIIKILCKFVVKLDNSLVITDLKKDKSLIVGQSSNVFNKSFLERKMELMNK